MMGFTDSFRILHCEDAVSLHHRSNCSSRNWGVRSLRRILLTERRVFDPKGMLYWVSQRINNNNNQTQSSRTGPLFLTAKQITRVDILQRSYVLFKGDLKQTSLLEVACWTWCHSLLLLVDTFPRLPFYNQQSMLSADLNSNCLPSWIACRLPSFHSSALCVIFPRLILNLLLEKIGFLIYSSRKHGALSSRLQFGNDLFK